LVWIHGLTSNDTLPLNGCSGQIVSFSKRTGWFGVEVHGDPGLKFLPPENLRCAIDQSGQLGSRARSSEGVAASIEEFSAQAAIEESMLEASASHDVGSINAQVSDALVRSSPAEGGPHVILLTFSRPSMQLRKILLGSSELAPCRAELEAQGHLVEVESGAKIFLRPEHYNPALAAVRLHGCPLYKNHVVVDIDLEDVVVQLAQQLHGPSFTYVKGKFIYPLGLTELAASSGYDITATGSFVQIHVPSSMRSESEPGAARTLSTTDADPRKRVSSRPARLPRRGGSSGARS